MNSLAILICHLPERSHLLRRLTHCLDRQIKNYPGLVYYRINDQGKGLPTGTKRNQMIEQSSSDYFCFADDDDMVSEDYVKELFMAIQSGPDVVTFDGYYTEFGGNRRNFTIKLGERYYEDPKDKEFYYHRFPNHLAVFKRSVVNSVKFQPIWQREDFNWADEVRGKKLLKTSVHIPKFLYWYDCRPKQQVPRTHVR